MAKKIYIGATGTETIGDAEARELPAGYTQVEYIESSGTQYINTGVSAPLGFRCVMDFVYLGNPSVESVLIGSHKYNGTPTGRNLFEVMDSKWMLGAEEYVTFGSPQANVEYNVDFCNVSGNVYAVINGVNQGITLNPSTAARNASSLYLFTLNFEGTIVNRYTSMKLKSCKIYGNDAMTIVRDYIPCKNQNEEVGLWDAVGKQFYTNAGSGVFTAGGVVYSREFTDKAKEVKNLYLGIGGIARKIKRAYIGIAGIAKLFFGSELFYLGNVSTSHAHWYRAGCKDDKDYGFFAGGRATDGNTCIGYVDAYDKTLTRIVPAQLSVNRDRVDTVSNNTLFLIGGGGAANTSYATVDTYNRDLTRGSAPSLSRVRCSPSAARVGRYMLFAGGTITSATGAYTEVDVYDESLTKTTTTALSVARWGACGANATADDGYALIAGGSKYSPYTTYTTVDAYSSDLTRVSAPSLTAQALHARWAKVGKYSVIAGGYIWTGSETANVNAYDKDLSLTRVADLTVANCQFGRCGDYAVAPSSRACDVYDSDLNKGSRPDLVIVGNDYLSNISSFGDAIVGVAQYYNVHAYQCI